MGGLGKTALVKSVYNNERINQYFDLKAWVCVPEEFIERSLMISIIKSLTGQNRNEMDIDQLQRILRDTLAGMRYLLVMDDVWYQNKLKWMDFKKFLLEGANGSKIVVTTRSKRVASIMSTTIDGKVYNLEGLSFESCLDLFMKCAFKKGQERHPNPVKIGEGIVKKCGGVPLVVKSMGSLLLSSTDENEWKNDFEFNNLDLNSNLDGQWDSPSHEESEELEHIGMRYLMELESSSFLQEFDKMGSLVFKMHDLVSFMSNNECSMVNSLSQVISKKVRHVSFVDVDIIKDGLPSLVSSIGHLRSILVPSDEIKPDQSFVDSCVLRFPRLRALDLSGSNIEVLPKKFGNLKHLRYLNLYSNRKMKKLSKSISKLQKLETLMFVGCSELKEIPRPISLRKLKDYNKTEASAGEYNWTMAIANCPSLLSLSCDIKYSTSLKSLIIIDCGKLNLRIEMEEDDSRQDLNSTRIQLKSIFIAELPNLEELPQWLLHGNTTESLQNLESLQLLYIWDCPKLTSLPEEMHPLISLRRFEIDGDCHAKRIQVKIGRRLLISLGSRLMAT
ncbi:hypothetical protein QYF36_008320 [Acer negundo]|nr:hypothetical protein QYF36_008320 [Acer negundo]